MHYSLATSRTNIVYLPQCNIRSPSSDVPSLITLTRPSRYEPGECAIVVTIPVAGIPQGIIATTARKNKNFAFHIQIANTGAGECLQMAYASPLLRDDSRLNLLDDIDELAQWAMRRFGKFGKQVAIRVFPGRPDRMLWRLMAFECVCWTT